MSSSPSKKVAESDVVTVVLQAISNAGRTAQLKRVVSDGRFICAKQMSIPRRPEVAHAKCPEGVCEGRSVLQCCSVALHAVCRY